MRTIQISLGTAHFYSCYEVKFLTDFCIHNYILKMHKLLIRAENVSNYITSYHHGTQLVYTKALFTLN